MAFGIEDVDRGAVGYFVVAGRIAFFHLIGDAILARHRLDLPVATGQAHDVLRIKSAYVIMKRPGCVARRVDGDEQDTHVLCVLAESGEHLHEPRHGLGTDVRAVRVAEVDERGVALEGVPGDGLAVIAGEREVEIGQMTGHVRQVPRLFLVRTAGEQAERQCGGQRQQSWPQAPSLQAPRCARLTGRLQRRPLRLHLLPGDSGEQSRHL